MAGRNPNVLVDSSILITALLSSTGGSFYVLSHYHDRVQFCISRYIMDETTEVLRRKFPDQKRLEHDLHLLIGYARIDIVNNPSTYLVDRAARVIEPEDAPILASAVRTCTHLLTLDNDFYAGEVVRFAEKKKLAIMKPKEFIDTQKIQQAL
jgi:predicted nucleic acid-binding protein